MPALLFLCFAVCVYIFYKRFPQNYKYSNFFAEDGNVFTQPLLNYPFFQVAFTPFNGYFIFGLYLLTEASRIVDAIFFRHSFVYLPQSIAVISYLFLSFCSVLPFLVLRHLVRYEWLMFLSITSALVPLGGWEYAIDGTIGNLKFAFVYVALVLVIRRVTSNSSLWEKFLIGVGLVICAYTNVTVYLIMPGLAVPIVDAYIREQKIGPVLQRNRSRVIEIVVLCMLLLPQVVMIAVKGTPKLIGYLDSPYEPIKTVNIILARPLLYGFFYWWYGSLNDFKSLALIGFFLWFMWSKCGLRRSFLSASILGVAVGMTILFVANRPGVAQFFSTPYGLGGGGPSQFFYPQNWMSYLAVTLCVGSMSSRWSLRSTRVLAATLTLLVLFESFRSDMWLARKLPRDRSMTLKNEVTKLCSSESGLNITFQIYPNKDFMMTVPKTLACNSLNR